MNPLHKLITLALRHIDEEAEASQRAVLLEAAAPLLVTLGDEQLAAKVTATAALLRSADKAQGQLLHILRNP